MLFAAVHESVHGTKRTYRDGLLLVRFRATAVKHARVASAASVVNDPLRTYVMGVARQFIPVFGGTDEWPGVPELPPAGQLRRVRNEKFPVRARRKS
jgi:hypothetical protein